MSSTQSPIEIIDFLEDANLNHVRWQQSFLEEIKSQYRLKHSQAILFCNVKKDRFRLVASFYGLPVLILPPIDPSEKISLYLKISEFMRKFNREEKVTEFLDKEIETASQRLERRKKMAEKALEKRGSK